MSSHHERRPVVVLISGRGSNMQAIAAAGRASSACGEVRAVISDQPAAAGLERARALGIATHCVSPRDYPDRAAFEAALAELIDRFAPAVIALAGFMRILGAQFVRHFEGRLLNVHPSLLPDFRGLDTHRRVLEAQATEHGASVHFVTEELDAGPLVIQARVPVLPGDSVESLSGRVQAVEHRIYPIAVDLLARGRLALRDGIVYLDDVPLVTPLSLNRMEAAAS